MNIYDKLLLLPFFQGIDRKELENIAIKIRFDFQKHAEGEWIVQENDRCDTLMLLMEGSMSAVVKSADHKYHIRERLQAPYAIEPERLFGLQQHLARSYQALTPCTLLRLHKDDVLHLCKQSLVFELNVLNTICTKAQRARSAFFRKPQTSIPRKIATFVANRCLYPAGEKVFYIRLTDLGKAIGESKLNVSHTIHALEKQGLLSFQRKMITIPQLEKLLVLGE